MIKLRIYVVQSDIYEWNNHLVTADLEKAMDLLKNHSDENDLEICGIQVWENEKHLFTYMYDDDDKNIIEDYYWDC